MKLKLLKLISLIFVVITLNVSLLLASNEKTNLNNNLKLSKSLVIFNLMEKKDAYVSDLIDILLIFKNIDPCGLQFNEKIKILKELNIISKKMLVYGENKLTKGFAALLFFNALSIEGGLNVRLFGKSRRTCLQELIYLNMMPDSAVNDKMSGPELITLLQNAKEYLNNQKINKLGNSNNNTNSTTSVLNFNTTSIENIKLNNKVTNANVSKNDNLNVLSNNLTAKLYSSDILNIISSSNDTSYLIPNDTATKYGLVLGYNYYKFENEDKNDLFIDTPSAAHIPDIKFWISKRLNANENYYLRLRYGRVNLKDDFIPNFSPDSRNIGPRIDVGYYAFNINPKKNFKFGRQFLKVGRGFTYAAIHDGIQFENLNSNFNLICFLARTQPRETNIDQSNNGYLNRSYRNFYGMQFDYLKLTNKKLYSYILFERDGNVKIPYNIKDFTYDANYYGLGIEGSIKPNWLYFGEYVLQTGKTAATDSLNGKDDIKANAYYIGTEYYFTKHTMSPFLILEYAFASGDSDRQSVTNVISGNKYNTKDNNFMPFGIYDLGLALHPRFSNISVFKMGCFMKPFYNLKRFKDLQVGVKYLIYNKDKADGAISDQYATLSNKKIGTGYDFHLTYRVFSDTLIYFNYGIFKPNDAYPLNRRDNTKLINFGTTLFF